MKRTRKFIKGALGIRRRRLGLRAHGYTPKLHRHRRHLKSVRVSARHPGYLHRALGVPLGQKIPMHRLQAEIAHVETQLIHATGAHRSKLRAYLRRLVLARTMRGFAVHGRRHRR